MFQVAKTINLYVIIAFVIDSYIARIGGIYNISTHAYRTDVDIDNFAIFWAYNLVYQWHAALGDNLGGHKLSDVFYHPELMEKDNLGTMIGSAINEPISL
jgi:hypothetical protein